MIFVTVGTDTHQFDRLIIGIDELAEKRKIKEKVIAQIGNCEYTPKNFKHFRFKPYEEVEKLTKKSTIVISHGGAGSIMLAFENKKPLIVVPRLKKYNEHINNHQIEITEELEKQGRILAVYKISELDDKIKKIKKMNSKSFPKPMIPEIIENFVRMI